MSHPLVPRRNFFKGERNVSNNQSSIYVLPACWSSDVLIRALVAILNLEVILRLEAKMVAQKGQGCLVPKM